MKGCKIYGGNVAKEKIGISTGLLGLISLQTQNSWSWGLGENAIEICLVMSGEALWKIGSKISCSPALLAAESSASLLLNKENYAELV